MATAVVTGPTAGDARWTLAERGWYHAGVSLEPKLQRWVQAGVVNEEQAQKIRELERGEARPTMIYALAGLAGLAIALGLMALVAGVWPAIPGRVKIAADLALVATLGACVWRWDRGGPAWAREAGIVALWGLVLASIALISQVYELGGEPHVALLTWSALTALLMSRARSGLAATLWVLGLQYTWGACSLWIAETWENGPLGFATLYWAPLVGLALAQAPIIKRARPALATVLAALAWGELVLGATLGTFALYSSNGRAYWDEAMPALLVSAALTVGLAGLLRVGLGARLLLIACLGLSHWPLYARHGQEEVAGALAFVGLWLLVAWAAHGARDARLLNTATAVIGARILWIYFEVLGSRQATGIGLIGGGLLTLLLVWIWTRQRRQFARDLGGDDA